MLIPQAEFSEKSVEMIVNATLETLDTALFQLSNTDKVREVRQNPFFNNCRPALKGLSA